MEGDLALIDAARARASAICADASPDDVAGVRDLHDLVSAVAAPAAWVSFRCAAAAARAAGAPGAAQLEAEARALAPLSGAMEVSFRDGAEKFFICLDACAPTHDLGAELEKFGPRFSGENRAEILQHLSRLVFLGRSAFAQLVSRRAAGAPELPAALQVDPANTTLFLCEHWPVRVGLFVRRADDALSDVDELIRSGAWSARL